MLTLNHPNRHLKRSAKSSSSVPRAMWKSTCRKRRKRSVSSEPHELLAISTYRRNRKCTSSSESGGEHVVLSVLESKVDPRCRINEIAPKPRKILQLLRLLQINNGVFVKVTKATQQMLRLVEPYITYGLVLVNLDHEPFYWHAGLASLTWNPSENLSINVDMEKSTNNVSRSQIMVSSSRRLDSMISSRLRISFTKSSPVALTLNRHVLLLADFASCLWMRLCQASNFLWPFKLSNPTGGWRTRKFKHYVQGGDFGDRETNINKLVRQMN